MACLSLVRHQALIRTKSGLLYPRSTEGGMGVYWIHPDVCPSVHPSVCRQGFRNVLKKPLAQLISYLAFTLMGWVSWPLYIFVFLASFSALWWSNIWPKIGFLELFEKTLGSINFIPGICPNGVSLLTPIQFRVPSLIFGPLVAKYLVENRVSGTYWKNYWFHSLHKLLQYLKYHDTQVGKMMPKFFWDKVFLKNSHLCSTRLQNRKLYLIFLDGVGSDQSGGLLSPFMGTACC